MAVLGESSAAASGTGTDQKEARYGSGVVATKAGTSLHRGPWTGSQDRMAGRFCGRTMARDRERYSYLGLGGDTAPYCRGIMQIVNTSA